MRTQTLMFIILFSNDNLTLLCNCVKCLQVFVETSILCITFTDWLLTSNTADFYEMLQFSLEAL